MELLEGGSNHSARGPSSRRPRSNVRVVDTAIAMDGEGEDPNIDGIPTGVRVDRNCEMALAEEDEDAMDCALPLPGSAMMNKGQQEEEVCMTNV